MTMSPTPPSSIRIATLTDVDALVSLVNGAYRGEASRAGWTTEADLLDGQRTDAAEIRAQIEDSDSVMLTCEQDRSLIACVHLRADGDGAYLGMLVVRPDLQASGLGKRLMDESERFVRARWGARRIWMTVLDVRAELISFYERRGYQRTGEFHPFPAVALSTPRVESLRFEKLVKNL